MQVQKKQQVLRSARDDSSLERWGDRNQETVLIKAKRSTHLKRSRPINAIHPTPVILNVVKDPAFVLFNVWRKQAAGSKEPFRPAILRLLKVIEPGDGQDIVLDNLLLLNTKVFAHRPA